MSAAKLESHTEPQEPPYFYLSYARADDESSMHDFFTDLSYSIRFKAKLTSTEVVGRWNTSRQERDEALRTSRVMIALLSPAYLSDEAALFEWKIFELRRRCALLTSHLSNSETLKRSIIPICWSPYSGSMPVEISQTPLFDGDLKSGSNVTGGVKSLAKNQYAAFVKSLAHYIIQVTRSFQLTPLEAIPDEVSNAFETVDKPTTNSQTTNTMPNKPQNQNINQNFLILDGPFVKSIAEQIKETGEQPSPVGSGNVSAVEEDGKYSVVFIDDNEEFLKLIKTVCNYSDQLSCETSQNPKKVLEDGKSNWHQYESAPDLFVVDLDFEAEELAGEALLAALAKKDEGIPSAILAASGDFSGNRLFDVTNLRRGIGAISKPYKMQELLDRMRHWAKIGRKRVARAKKTYAQLVTRTERPVFLSYSSLDEDVATFINNGFEDDDIEVFYAPIAIRGGDEVDPAISEGLQHAKVFIPLISKNFETSNPCIAELVNACDLKKRRTKDRPLDIIPVFYDTPVTSLQNEHIQECLPQNQGVKMSSKNRTEGLQELLVSVQHRLRVQVTKA